MAYYTKVLQADESVKYAGRLHWIIYQNAILAGVVTAVVSMAFLFVPPAGAILAVYVIPILLLLTAGLCLVPWFRRVTTEIVVTDKRIIHKTGWISRHTEEINITKVETVDVIQGIGGRILGYGTVVIKGTGGNWEPLHQIDAPLQLRNTILIG
ncbi:MAG: PH domain-containing protein [Acetobacteraceae bacterium]|nr:PH domain-containing protein [Acetobacteraceae bacterium]